MYLYSVFILIIDDDKTVLPKSKIAIEFMHKFDLFMSVKYKYISVGMYYTMYL